jgi:spore coat polysaccharide biosynthesis protein SpsF (cytidylyltransferase family)
MSSTRLPGKALLLVDNKLSALEFVISQVRYSKLLDDIILATTDLPEDDKLIEVAKKEKINFFRGSSHDVLKRFYDCAKFFSVSTIVRITADNPLIDPTLIDDAIKKFNSKSYDYVSNCLKRTFPYGTEVEVFSFNALESAWKLAKKNSEHEHVTPFFYNNPKKFKILNIENAKNLSHFRWTVDRINDLKLVKQIIKKISKRPILMCDILELLKKEPNLILLNNKNTPNEGYLKSLDQD